MKQRFNDLFNEFFDSEQASGLVLMVCTAAALILANSPAGEAFLNLRHVELGFDLGGLHLRYDLEHWINDGLMAVFFLLIGLEIERELYIGELSDRKNASLPVIAALGGMAIPALVYLILNRGTETQNGFGIPMATDIAFALGILALAGKRVPVNLKIFLTALAIIDDLGAILVIALFYSSDFSLVYLGLAAGVFVLLLALNRLGNRSLPVYVLLGLLMWYLVLQSGIHAAIAGVLLAFAIPFDRGKDVSLSYRLQHALHKPAAFFIMPLFALANTGIILTGMPAAALLSPASIGIFLGLVAGKPAGILLFSLLAIRLGLSKLPEGVSAGHLAGAGFLGGIGFTMSIFITLLAYGDSGVAATAKLAVLLGSIVAGTAGFLILRALGKHPGEERALP